VPTATNYDQLTYILDAKSFYETGRDMSGAVTLPEIFLFHYPVATGMQAELPYLLLLLTVGPFGLSLTSAALPNVLLGTATVGLMYLIARKFFDHRTGLIAAALSAVNPWLIFSSRTAYETVPATFFYLLMLYLFLLLRGRKLLLIIPVLLLAFYSYIGTKLIFIPFVLICAGYAYFFLAHKKSLRYYLILVITAFGIVTIFAYQMLHQPTSRLGDLFLPNDPHVSQQVDTARKGILSPVTTLFANKATIYGRTLMSNIFTSLSPQYLFGEGDYFFGLERHGLFYIIDALFLLIGIIGIFHTHKKPAALIGILLALSLLPQVFHNPEGKDTFTPHIALFFPLLLLLIAYGGTALLRSVTRPSLRLALPLGLFLVYGFFVGNFLFLYFYRLPLNDAIFVFPNRVVSRYLRLAAEKNLPLTIHVGNPHLFMREYLFYSGTYEGTQVALINSLMQHKRYALGSLNFTQCTTPEGNGITLYEAICDKKPNGPTVIIPHLKDSGTAFLIQNDTLCNDGAKQRFITELKFADLNVTRLSQRDFCARYVIAYQ
jgi:4-amino-4-deoxy-L-arabinose transferase-like glycosyltransferase